MKKMTTTAAFLVLIAALTNLLAILVIVPLNFAINASTQKTQQAAIQVFVSDAVTGEPLQNATVCIVETKQYYQTDFEGKTEIIQVPYTPSTAFDSVIPQNWGTVTILTYKDGYVDYILFNVQVFKTKTRPPQITLYKEYDGGGSLHTIVESPDDDWVRELVKTLKK